MAKKKLPEEHPIDKLFRDGMEQRQFVYEEKYWEEAEKALAGFNRTASRKRLGWWLGGAATLLLIISVFVWQRNTGNGNNTSEHTAMSGSEVHVPVSPIVAPASGAASATADASTVATSSAAILPEQPEQPLPTGTQSQFNSNTSNTTLQNTGNTVDAGNTANNTANNSSQPVTDQAETPTAGTSVREQESSTVVAVDPEDVQEVPNNDPMADPAIAISSALTQGALPPRDLGQPRIQWYAGMYAGTQRSYPAFTGGPGIWSSYLEDKERQAFSPVISLEAGMKIKRLPIDINLGVSFMQMGEDGLFAITNTLHDTTITIDIDSTLIIDSTWVDTAWAYTYDWIVTEDSIIMISSNDTTIIRKASNRLYYVEIPVLFGYVWQYNNWNFRLTTGPSIGILHKRAGYYPNDDFTAFEALEDVDYFNKTVWYWRAEPAIGYSISPNVLLQCRGSFRLQLTDTYAADDRSLRYWTHGLQMGLRYTFTGK